MPVATKGNEMKEPNLPVETFWSVFKGMFALLIFTNLLWACIHFGYVYKSFSGTGITADMNQYENTYTNQTITNG